MLKRMVLGSLLMMLLSGSALAGESETQKEVKVLKHVYVTTDGDSETEHEVLVELLEGGDNPLACVSGVGSAALCLVSEDRLEEAGMKLADAIAQLTAAGELSDKGATKLLALVEQIGENFKSQSPHNPLSHSVTIMKDGNVSADSLHKAFAISLDDIEGAEGVALEEYRIALKVMQEANAGAEGEAQMAFQIAMEQLEEATAGAEAGALRAYAVTLGETEGEPHQFTIEPGEGEAGEVRILKLDTDTEGIWTVEDNEFTPEMLEKIKQHHGENIEIEVFMDSDGNVHKAGPGVGHGKGHGEGHGSNHDMFMWQGEGHGKMLNLAGDHQAHEHAMQEWFEEWHVIVDDMAERLNASDVDRIHEQLSWLKEHIDEAGGGHPRMMMFDTQGGHGKGMGGLFFSPEHKEELMELHGLPHFEQFNLETTGELDHQQWFSEHGDWQEFHDGMLDEHQNLLFDHEALIEEIRMLVKELVEQHLQEREQ